MKDENQKLQAELAAARKTFARLHEAFALSGRLSVDGLVEHARKQTVDLFQTISKLQVLQASNSKDVEARGNLEIENRRLKAELEKAKQERICVVEPTEGTRQLCSELENRAAEVKLWKDTAIELEKQLRDEKDMNVIRKSDLDAVRDVARERYDEIQALKAQLAASSGERKRLEEALAVEKDENCELRRQLRVSVASFDAREALVNTLIKERDELRASEEAADKRITQLEKELRETRQDLDGERKALRDIGLASCGWTAIRISPEAAQAIHDNVELRKELKLYKEMIDGMNDEGRRLSDTVNTLEWDLKKTRDAASCFAAQLKRMVESKR